MSKVYNKDYDKVVCSGIKKPKKGKEISLFLPPNISVNQLSQVVSGELNNVEAKKRKFHEKKVVGAALFYTYLFKNVLFHQDCDTERWVQVSWQDCRTMLGKEYADILQCLVDNGLVERLEANEDGVVHKHGRGYYWSSQVHDKKIGSCKKYRIPVQLLSEEKLFTIIKQAATPILVNKLNDLTAPVHAIREQYREMALYNMSDVILLDTPESRAVLDRLYAEGNIQLRPDEYLDLINSFPLEVPVICDFGHRAHHRIVRLHHALRPWLRFKDALDEEMVELDIVASQPTILANISPKLIKKYAPECASAIPLFEKYSERADYKRYQELCFRGEIYEYLRDQYNDAYPHQYLQSVTRDDAKKMVFVAFFSNYDYREQAAGTEITDKSLLRYLMADNQEQAADVAQTLFKKNAYELFKRLFPSLHALFTELKGLKWEFNPGQQHSNNCLLAQRIESGIIYTRFVKALVAQGITRFTTTHDAINVKRRDEPKARKIIQAEIKKAGLHMQLKTKEQVPVVAASEEPIVAADPILDAWWLNPQPTAAEPTETADTPVTDMDQLLALIEQREQEHRAATSHLSTQERLELLDAAWV